MVGTLLVLLWPVIYGIREGARRAEELGHQADELKVRIDTAVDKARREVNEGTEAGRYQIELAKAKAIEDFHTQAKKFQETQEQRAAEKIQIAKEEWEKRWKQYLWYATAFFSALSTLVVLSLVWRPCSRAFAAFLVRRTAPGPRHIPVDEDMP